MEKAELEKKIAELEAAMNAGDFWSDKNKAQAIIKEIQDLKDQLTGVGKYDRGDAIVSIFSGAGGDDAEDFSRMLLEMYAAYFKKKGWNFTLLHEHMNDHHGYRNVTVEVSGKNVYGNLKNESGVHRLVRISPFNANDKRQTSFSMVEVVPKLDAVNFKKIEIPDKDLRVELSRAGGPGGQNVNKRETAVRIVHIPTNISAHVTSERTQERNKEKALELVKAKLVKKLEDEHAEKLEDLKISKDTSIEWGNQIRSYVLHPYKLVKDHRTNVEIRDVEAVLERGDIEPFIEALKE